jgi:hypothetical protein
MEEHGGHEDLHGLGHQSVIPYVHESVVLLCVRCSSRELNLRRVEVKRTCLVLTSTRTFYSSRLTVTMRLAPRQVKPYAVGH